MAKVIDITEKLSFDGNPRLKIRDVEIEVNADAETVLKLLGEMQDGVAPENTVKMINLLITGESREALRALNLQFWDYQKVLLAAIELVVDTGEEAPGEAETHTTT